MTFDFCALRRLDAYSKPLEDFRIKTLTGAIVTLVSAILMVLLFISELNFYLTIETSQELFVDTSREEKIKITFDIVFPVLPCAYLSLDTMDVSGENQLDVDHDLYKIRLNSKEEPIMEKEKHDPAAIPKRAALSAPDADKPPADSKDPNYCGSCYGAETQETKCCNSCDAVRKAYRARGWALSDPEKVDQCISEGWGDKIKNAGDEGCRMHGTLAVNKVSGNFHFAPGRSFTQAHSHVHDLQELGTTNFNLTHRITHLSFGKSFPAQINPLNKLNVTVQRKSAILNYYLKIVPTTYAGLDGVDVDTNQYSVTKHIKDSGVSGTGGSGLPGVFFIYEISPILVKIMEKQRSFGHFITSCCAIIGGTFTVSSLVDALIYHSSRALHRKIELGKAA